jgi:hypothetical protein
MKKSYYAGKIELEGWPINERGLHQPMITIEELEINTAIANGRKIRRKQQYNPDFKLNLSLHESCVDNGGKLTGINHTNGKGWWRKEYVCRACKKRIPRDIVDNSMLNLLNSLVLNDKGVKELKTALKQVWNNNESYRTDRIQSLQVRKVELGEKKSQMIHSLSVNHELADDIKEELIKIKVKIAEVDILIGENSNVNNELDEFAEFALDYTEDLRNRWWELPGEKLQECKHLIFRNKIIVQPNGDVYTPDLSYIYSLGNENDDPEVVENHNMVELVGTAPTSIGLLNWMTTSLFYLAVLDKSGLNRQNTLL